MPTATTVSVPPQPDLDTLAKQAKAGHTPSLDALLGELQHLVYRLALRFLANRADAEDATQDILVKVSQNLDRFEGRSKVTTWVYSISARHLMRVRQSRMETSVGSPEEFGAILDASLGPDHVGDDIEYRELAGEIRMTCTYGMLATLSRDVRIAYLLGDLLGMPDRDGADILGTSRATYRQRVSRARRTMRGLMADRCGLLASANPCRCSRQVDAALSAGVVDKTRRPFASHPGVTSPIPADTLRVAADQLDAAEAIAEIYRSDPTLSAPASVLERLREAAPDLVR